jgi:hypothetical protein
MQTVARALRLPPSSYCGDSHVSTIARRTTIRRRRSLVGFSG